MSKFNLWLRKHGINTVAPKITILRGVMINQYPKKGEESTATTEPINEKKKYKISILFAVQKRITIYITNSTQIQRTK